MRALTVLLLVVVSVVVASAADALAQGKKGTGLDFKTLPAAVRMTIEANLKGGEIGNISKEDEGGVEQYEVESVLRGKERDFNVDSNGVLLAVEEATTIDAIPAAARAGILKKVGTGKINTIETFTRPGRPVMYEAGYTNKAGKKHEVLVKADGTETKE